LPQPNWPRYPSARSLIENSGDEESIQQRIHENYHHLGRGLHELGITVDAAPVADLLIPEAHDVIGDRAFAYLPEEVAKFARACAEGLGEAGVIPTVKHLPGYGRASVDPHKELPIVRENEEFLKKSDFLPFQLLADLPWGMTSHLLFPELDTKWPATLSEKIIGNIIRDWIGFDGVLVTDCLFMKALSGTMPDRIQRCLEVGCDLALHSHGELADLEQAVVGLKPISDLSWERWERSLKWVNEKLAH
jgi:beta-N-acetylhexosaminidase